MRLDDKFWITVKRRDWLNVEIGKRIFGMIADIAKAEFGLFAHERVDQLIGVASQIGTNAITLR
jgi:hypothetical protein